MSRMTIRLDDDVADLLYTDAASKGESMNAAVNRLLRSALVSTAPNMTKRQKQRIAREAHAAVLAALGCDQ